jgi:hypothetical protein
MITPMKPQRLFILLDTSVLLGYYVPEAATNPEAQSRITTLLEAVRHHRADVHLFVPNIVVAELYCQLARLCYSGWDKRVSSKFPGTKKTLDTRRYKSACDKFRRDIHNGALLYQYELNRYHVLSLDLIAPIDKYRKYYRSKNVRSMGASDLLLGAMAMHLSRVHGLENVALLSCDRRMKAIFEKAPQSLNLNTAVDLGLYSASDKLGFGRWNAKIYPKVIDLARCNDSELEAFFGGWPLPTKKIRNVKPKA